MSFNINAVKKSCDLECIFQTNDVRDHFCVSSGTPDNQFVVSRFVLLGSLSEKAERCSVVMSPSFNDGGRAVNLRSQTASLGLKRRKVCSALFKATNSAPSTSILMKSILGSFFVFTKSSMVTDTTLVSVVPGLLPPSLVAGPF